MEFPITGYDVDGDPGHGPSDRTSHATVTISGGFMADEDSMGIRNATEDGNFQVRPIQLVISSIPIATSVKPL